MSLRLISLRQLSIFLSVALLAAFVWVIPAYAAPCTITVTNTNNSGAGSLRQAITDANVSSNVDTICFSIGSGPRTISPTSALPAVTQPAEIDGTTQPGFTDAPLIEINGLGVGGTSPGIWVTAGDTLIKGLIVNRFGGNGIILTNNGGNTIKGNYIGTNSAGTADFGNGADGLGMLESPNNVVGGTTAADRNVISGNQGNGIGITGSTATGNTVIGNYVGTNAAGTAAIPNSADGMLVNDSPNTVIGGTSGVTPGGACTGACNLFSGNSVNGIGLWFDSATGTTIEGNYVGVNVNGDTALANGDIAVEINEAANNTVGGTTPQERNILSGNLGAGILLTGAGATGNTVSGNYIGTNAAGNAAIPNKKMGVSIGNSPGIGFAHHNTIGGHTGTTPGGSCTGACNVISGNQQNGIYITGNGGSNQIVGNFIGAGASGGSKIGNGLDGIGIDNSPNNSIGGPFAQARNLISGNGSNGIILANPSSSGNRIEGNYIGMGTDAGGMANASAGIMVAAGLNNAIIGNGIFNNGWLGIDIGYNNVSPNDAGDPDVGPNQFQNYPSVTSLGVSGSNTVISGTFNSNANTSFRLEFFVTPACNAGAPLNHGEGRTFIGGATAFTDGAGNASFSYTFSGVPSGQFVTATATRIIGQTPWETSEFSACSSQLTPVPQVPRQHPDGTIIKAQSNNDLYIIESNQKRRIGYIPVMQSWNFTNSDIKMGTDLDMGLTTSSNLYFREGALLKGSSADVYVVDQTGASTFAKRRITSLSAFQGLGYVDSDILYVNDVDLPSTNGSDITSANQHPDGAVVKDPGSASMYLVEGGQKRYIGSPAVFLSQHFRSDRIETATATDLSLTQGSDVYFREGTLVKGSSSTMYVIDQTGTTTFVKRAIGSPDAFISLGYTSSDVFQVPDAALPADNGPMIN